MTKSPMHMLLDHLVDNADDPETGAPVQIQLKLGQMMAGGLRRHPEISGIFQFMTIAEPGQNAPEQIRQQGQILICQSFEPDAVNQVMEQFNAPEASRIITPGAH